MSHSFKSISDSYLLCRQEVNVQQFPLTVDQWQQSDRDVIISIEVCTSTTIVIAVVFHGHQG